MRFNQLKKNPNAIIRKKLYKKGKCWVVASSLAFASGLMLLGASGMSVQADEVSDNTPQDQAATGVDGTATPNNSDSASVVTGGMKSGDPNDSGDVVPQIAEPEKPLEHPQMTGTGTQTSSEPSNGDSTAGTIQQTGNGIASTGDSTANETQKTQDTTYVNYDPNVSEYTDTSNWDSSHSKDTIADDQIPDTIMREGISQRGMDGTSPYFITKAKNLYFLNGTLNAKYTDTLLSNTDFMRNNVLNIDTSLAKKVYLPAISDNIFSQIGASQMGIPTSKFYSPEYAPTMNFSNIDTNHVTSMAWMFNNDVLPSLDLSNFNTSKVMNMSHMFDSITVPSLNLSGFDTSAVTNMSHMFYYLNFPNANAGLPAPSLDLSNFNTSKVTDMSYMFNYAVFSSLNLKSFDTSNVTDMSYMFSNAAFPSLDLSNFNTSKVKTMKDMFDELNSVIYFSEKDNKNMYTYSPAILNISSITGDGLSDPDAIDSMFSSARVKNVNMPNFKVDSDTVTSASSVFDGITADTVSIPKFDGSKIQNWSLVFEDAHINKLDISNWNMSTNSDNGMFYGALIKQITLGPANKFPAYTNLSFRDNGDGDTTPDASDQWIGISENGVVDSPETVLSFYAGPTEENNGINKYYDGSGKVGVKTFVPMVGIIGKVTLKAPTTVDGKAGEDVVYPDLYGKIGVPITLDVPAKEGYRADKKTITATVTDKGITTDDVINYTKIPTGGGGGTSENIFISDRPQTSDAHRISIYPDQGNVTLYKQEGQKFVPITNREVEAGSDWYFDKEANVGSENSDMKYYRVSTNEWVRANQAYLYQPNKVIIRTNAGAPKQLIHAEGTLATSRMLSPDTEWYSDLIGDLGESQYYRVATNEFVKKSDVTVIKNA